MNNKKNEDKTFYYIIIAIILTLILAFIPNKQSLQFNQPKKVEYKKESYVEKLIYVEDIIERNLKDSRSYRRENYDVTYDERGYVKDITITFSATNSFGGRVTEKYKFTFNNGRLLTEKIY